MYETAAQGSVAPRDSLGSDLDRLLGRMGELRNRLEKLGDYLLGSEPRPAEVAHEITTQLDNLLSRIESRI